MQVLSQKNVNIPNKVLQTAIVLPKEMEVEKKQYPGITMDLLKNPVGTAEWEAKLAQQRK